MPESVPPHPRSLPSPLALLPTRDLVLFPYMVAPLIISRSVSLKQRSVQARMLRTPAMPRATSHATGSPMSSTTSETPPPTTKTTPTETTDTPSETPKAE